MATPSIRSRAADLQVPISRIQSLATATLHMLDDMGSIENDGHRRIVEHVTNFVDLIFNVALEASQEATAIEIDAARVGGH